MYQDFSSICTFDLEILLLANQSHRNNLKWEKNALEPKMFVAMEMTTEKSQ